jgi:hypothetical protein
MLGHESHDAVLHAKMLAVGTAVLAKTAGERAFRDRPIAYLYISDSGANFDNLAQAIMTDGDGKQGKDYAALRSGLANGRFAHMQVATIEARAQNSNQNFAGTDVGNRNLLYPHRLA